PRPMRSQTCNDQVVMKNQTIQKFKSRAAEHSTPRPSTPEPRPSTADWLSVSQAQSSLVKPGKAKNFKLIAWPDQSNAPRSNAPTLQRSNAPTLQRSNAPTLQRSNAPTSFVFFI